MKNKRDSLVQRLIGFWTKTKYLVRKLFIQLLSYILQILAIILAIIIVIIVIISVIIVTLVKALYEKNESKKYE